ncbi:MAG: acyl-CoA synthetase [Anaerolineaceae bacterium]|nr:acyl-CoA synthetase [Anaerolineaceae bacterium]
MVKGLKPFFSASGIAIIGASAKPNKLSYGIVKNLTLYGYQGAIYPVNPGAKEILGLTCYPDIKNVPDPVELAVIVLPAGMILPVVKDCAERGIKAVTVISGGFKELGEEGQALENEVLDVIKQNGMRMVGPNCVGTMSLHTGLNTTFISGAPDVGGIGFLSQSGAVLGGVVDFVKDKGIGFAHFSSLGNEADVTETDMIEYLGDDPNTTVITAYVEQIREGQRFLEVVKNVSQQKPIVLLKAGRTAAGARAVSSHTGSLAGSHAAYQAAFKQGGVVEVQSVNDLFDVSQAFALQHLPQGKRVVILTNSGGPAALTSDSLAMNGLEMADLDPKTIEYLRSKMNPSAQVTNPIDMLGGAEPQDYEVALLAVIADPNVDIIVPILVPQSLVNPVEVAQKISEAAATTQKTVISCFMGDAMVAEPRRVLHKNKVPMVVYPESIGTILGAMLRYKTCLDQPQESAPVFADIQRETANKLIKTAAELPSLGEAETRPLLAAYGIPVVAGGFAKTAEDAARLADQIGYPVVMKIVSPQILHKSDVGGIRLNLNRTQEVVEVFQDMMEQISLAVPEAILEGVLIEKMAPKGQEVIVGMRRDPGFGPMMMFGMGGIFVELFKDVAFKVAPITRLDALDMIQSTKAGTLLAGYRGMPETDINAVVDMILRLSVLALDYPQIGEIEINPLVVFPKGEGALALDGRVIFGG